MSENNPSMNVSSTNRFKSENFLPRFFRTEANKKFLNSTIDQLLTPGVSDQLEGYIGRRDAKSTLVSTTFITSPTQDRNDYQLEPSVVSLDPEGGTEDLFHYIDLINKLRDIGSNVDDESSVNSQEYLSWNPHINWDMFINYTQYYWIPNGPVTVQVSEQGEGGSNTIPVSFVDGEFIIGNRAPGAVLDLYRTYTYTFSVYTPGHPFSIKINGETFTTEDGEFTISLDNSAPDEGLYGEGVDLGGQIRIYDPAETIDVDVEIVGAKYFTDKNGVALSNGMKIRFEDSGVSEEYRDFNWYVDGVGESITLTKEDDLRAYSGDDLSVKEYMTISRSSMDGNAWSRTNRWFHRSVIEKSMQYNDMDVVIDEASRAKRPIIEFEPNLKLFNSGVVAKAPVDLIDTHTSDIFSTIVGAEGYIIDGVPVESGHRVLFTNDTDSAVNNKIYEVSFVEVGGVETISLTPTDDSDPLELDTVVIKLGSNQDNSYHYTGGEWLISQQKTAKNQPPLFQLCCPQGIDLNNAAVFDSSTFFGTKIFSFKEGNSAIDPELGLSPSYRTFENVGDLEFEFNLHSDTYTFESNGQYQEKSVEDTFLRKYYSRDEFEYTNGWKQARTPSKQRVIRNFTPTSTTSRVELDMFSDSSSLTINDVVVYKNGDFLIPGSDYAVTVEGTRAFVDFVNQVTNNDVIIVKSDPVDKVANGYFEIPQSLHNNPFNQNFQEITYGEASGHFDQIVETVPGYTRGVNGFTNTRDLGDITVYGNKIVKNSAPWAMGAYHILSEQYNIIDAIEYAKKSYSDFKRLFLDKISTFGYDGPIRNHFDIVINDLNRGKGSTSPFYASDMLAYSTPKRNEFRVTTSGSVEIDIDYGFTMEELSMSALYVYANGVLLVHGRDYTIVDSRVVLENNPGINTLVEIYYFDNTLGSFIPTTPSKLGLFPSYEPNITIDDAYSVSASTGDGPFKVYGQITGEHAHGWIYPVYTSKSAAIAADGGGNFAKVNVIGLSTTLYATGSGVTVSDVDNESYNELDVGIAFIRGHDGSLTVAFKDYRDSLLLELEKRIFNNIKVRYDRSLYDVTAAFDGKFRTGGISESTREKILSADFMSWVNDSGVNYTLNTGYNADDEFTYNYSKATSAIDGEPVPGHWRGIYLELFDTERPNATPWEMLGYASKPSWWESVYGPAPYTKNNLILWGDIERGAIRDQNGDIVRFDNNYARPGIIDVLPVDDFGRLLSPIASNCIRDFSFISTKNDFAYGDMSPAEAAWKRDSEYMFGLLKVIILSNPVDVVSKFFDVSRNAKNLAGQTVYQPTLNTVNTRSLVFPDYKASLSPTLTSGLVNFMMGYLVDGNDNLYESYKSSVTTLDVRMASRLGGFIDKSRISFYLDPNSFLSADNIGREIPGDDFDVFLNTTSSIDTVNYSAVIIEKVSNGYSIRGFNTLNPTFEYYAVGETTRDSTIDVGGVSEQSVTWAPNRQYIEGLVVSYQSRYYRVTVDHVSTSIFNPNFFTRLTTLPTIGGRTARIKKFYDSNKVLSATYGTVFTTIQSVVDFLTGYGYRLKDLGFDFDYYDNSSNQAENWEFAAREFVFWTTQGWENGTTISISPGANRLRFHSELSVVDDLVSGDSEYSFRKADGTALSRDQFSVYRNGNEIIIETENSDYGLYNVTLPLIQKEHTVIFDNTTSFGDIIYNQALGIRQNRIKVSGLITSDWNGSLNVPGFIYDQVAVEDWVPWKDYAVSDVVKYKQYYYTAPSKIYGTETFDESLWDRLNEKPESKLLANIDHKIVRLSDLYDPNIGSYDKEDQRLAKQLVGYIRRDYLRGIFQNDTSEFKFYQGFVLEKGTLSAIEKLFKTVGKNGPTVDVYEDWAILSSRYGDVDNRERVEVIIDEQKLENNSNVFEFTNVLTPRADRVYSVPPFELSDYPANYDSRPFPTHCLKRFIIDSGYVHEDDVDYKAGSEDELSSTNVNLLNIGEYIWMTNSRLKNWTVFQTSVVDLKVTEFNSNIITDLDGRTRVSLTVDQWVRGQITENEFIGVIGATTSGLNGIYEVAKASYNTVEIYVNADQSFQSFTQGNLSVLKLLPVRFETAEEFNTVMNTRTAPGQLVWLDEYSSAECREWAVLKNTPVYQQAVKYVDSVTDDDAILLRDPTIDPETTRDVFEPMIIRINTEFDEDSLEFKLPIERLTRNVPYYTYIDWGDGTVVRVDQDGIYSHVYDENAIYDVKIYGFIDHYGAKVNSEGVVDYNELIDTNVKISSLVQWGDVAPNDISFAFISASSMTGVPTNLPNSVTTMIGTFAFASSFNDANIAQWDVSNVSNISGLFSNAITFNVDIDSWNTSNFLTLDEVFEFASDFDQPLNSWDVSSVVTMRHTFDSASSFNKPLSNWSTSNVTDMTATFALATSFDQDLGNWDLSSVLTTRSMFEGALLFNNGSTSAISDWTTSSVLDMSFMFSGAAAFNRELGYWDVSSVQNMKSMFANASTFNNGRDRGVVGSSMNTWDTSSVTDMSYMFYASTAALETSAFNQNISSWNTSSLTEIKGMFQNAVWFNSDISYKEDINAWNTSNINNMDAMFYFAASFNADIGNWLVQNVESMEYMFTGATVFNQNLTCWDVEKIESEPTRFAFNCPIDTADPRFKPLWGQAASDTTDRTGASCSDPTIVEFEVVPDTTLVNEGQGVNVTVRVKD